MEQLDFTGQTLDGKYQMTRELGRGGMGTVYLATHLGTERPVAVKIIAPQYMERTEFVERFRREARAAGRLRHPNVVDVTDFGFAETKLGQVAYLVMEYLDGCTLGEVLDEEQNLPVSWTLDILDQVCSAVHEAHEQGIIHRDLKPDNIWLEPNQRGGYTVKVLDFGIAKLEENDMTSSDELSASMETAPTLVAGSGTTFAGDGSETQDGAEPETKVSHESTVASGEGALVSEASTIALDPITSEGETAILSDGGRSADYQNTIGTRVLSEASGELNSFSKPQTVGRSLYDSASSGDLTRVGAVLGTPLYMSPEQCRGERLDARSDIYSLGVIAYQMLSGRPPFEGNFKDVMNAHQTQQVRPLAARNVRRKMKRAIHSALAKNPDERPQSAEAFASALRAHSEGIWGLLRRAMVIYSEHLPKFLILSAFLSIPIIVFTLILTALSYLKVSEVSPDLTVILISIAGLLLSFFTAFCTNLIVGTICWIVIQYLSVPLRPIRLRPALNEARRKWKPLALSGVLQAFLPFVAAAICAIAGLGVFGFIGLVTYPLVGSIELAVAIGAIGAGLCGFVGLFWAYVSWILVPTVVMLENTRVIEAFRRSRMLVKRSFLTAAAAVGIMLVIPAIIAGSISFVVNVSAKAFDQKQKTGVETTVANAERPAVSTSSDRKTSFLELMLGDEPKEQSGSEEKDMRSLMRESILESLVQILWLPMQIIVFSFSAIIIALLYLKTRLAGGESMNELIGRFEDDGRPRKKWQERVRQRLLQSGRISGKPSNPE